MPARLALRAMARDISTPTSRASWRLIPSINTPENTLLLRSCPWKSQPRTSTSASSIAPLDASRLNFALVSANLSSVLILQRASADSSDTGGILSASAGCGAAIKRAAAAAATPRPPGRRQRGGTSGPATAAAVVMVAERRAGRQQRGRPAEAVTRTVEALAAAIVPRSQTQLSFKAERQEQRPRGVQARGNGWTMGCLMCSNCLYRN
mmetsp:Transcript_36388/g.91932  ORF Transcript_36388/g.91932 Transcript_36388/m.91932 type:complete len:208 (+) Transcript_36388:526-1149(+)